jgi:hypothetical protein
MVVAEKQTQEIATSTLVFPLFNGKINGKSKINLDKFVDTLEPNLQKALVQRALSKVGIGIKQSDNDIELCLENQELFTEYGEWLKQKALRSKQVIDLKQKNYATAEKL